MVLIDHFLSRGAGRTPRLPTARPGRVLNAIVTAATLRIVVIIVVILLGCVLYDGVGSVAVRTQCT